MVAPLNDYLLSEIARRISEAGQLTSTATYEIWKLQNLGISQREIKKHLRKLLEISHRQLRQLLTQSAEVGYNYDIKNLPFVQAVPFSQNAVLQQTIAAAVKLAQDDLTNMVQTIGFVTPDGKAYPLTQSYKKACDYAFEQVFTGATNYNTAIRQATKNLADMGVRVIDYESGVHTSLEAAVRRNIMGGLGLMQEQISRQNHDDLGADGWEISAHAASAPDHEPIQGKQYSDAEYTALNGSLQRRIGTLNCGHASFPIILGVNSPQYTPEQLRKFREDNEAGVTYQGKHYTKYEATQMQRRLETAMRTQKRRTLTAEATGDTERLTTAQIRLQRLRDEYGRFSKAAGLPTQNERAQVAGFGGGQAARAAAAVQGLENSIKMQYADGVKLDSVQFGKKAGKHASDFGFAPGDQEGRRWLEQEIERIAKAPDRAVKGMWRGQGEILESGQRADGPVDFLISGQDVVVAKDGAFITILKDGAINNMRVKRALKGGGPDESV